MYSDTVVVDTSRLRAAGAVSVPLALTPKIEKKTVESGHVGSFNRKQIWTDCNAR